VTREAMKKFLFNQMFDEEVIEQQRLDAIARLEDERLAEENAPPTYTVEELEEAKNIAHQQGKQEGKAEAMASIEQQASLTLDLVLRQIGDLLSEYKDWTAEVHHDSISMALSIMRKLAPELLRGSELPQVEHIVNEAFQFLTDQPKVMIRVASELEGALSSKVNLMASRVGYEGQVVLTGDPELELTDCRISWYAGAVERSLDETWGQIDEMVDRVLRGLPAREHPEPPVDMDGVEDDEQTTDDDEAALDGDAETSDDDGETPDDDTEIVGDGGETPSANPNGDAQEEVGDAALSSSLQDDPMNSNPEDDAPGQDSEHSNDVDETTRTPPYTEPERAPASEE
jgi:flagellar assembly protein FliH